MLECGDLGFAIGGEQFHNLQFCIPSVIYVNPFSESLIELGTKENPFKEISTAVLVMQNFMNSGPEEIVIKIMEKSILSVSPDVLYFVKHGLISIQTYTDTDYEPRSATVIFEEGITPSKGSRSHSVILSNFTFSLEELISKSGLSDSEIIEISKPQMGFHIVG